MKQARYLLVALFVAAALLLAGCTSGGSKGEGGDPSRAPAFTLQGLDGKKTSLESYRGKVVLLDFWATWCPPCRESIPGIEKLHAAYADKGLVVLAISMDTGDWDAVKAFTVEHGMRYTVLKGTDAVAQDYLVRTIPTFVVIDKEGIMRKRFLGSGTEDDIEKEIKALL